LCNFGGAALWASIMVTLAFFLGRLIPLPELIQWIAKFGIVALMLVITWIVVTIWWESRKPRLKTED
jgi:membrane protein DedA with SNARE-associated domain